jgi:PAB1-binding protein PBP1
VYNLAVGFGAWDAGECFWNGSGYMAVAPAEIKAVDGKMPEGIVCGAAAGQQLLSLLQADEKIGDQCEDKAGRSLKPWEEDSGEGNENDHGLELTYIKQLDVPLEDMEDAGGEWDQFVVNEERFGVKSTFKEDLSQYTTVLDVKTVPAEVRNEAERVANEIEEERQALGCLDGDANSPETACDKECSEEDKFSAVARRSGSAAVLEAAS